MPAAAKATAPPWATWVVADKPFEFPPPAAQPRSYEELLTYVDDVLLPLARAAGVRKLDVTQFDENGEPDSFVTLELSPLTP
jgi:hypothetical protein